MKKDRTIFHAADLLVDLTEREIKKLLDNYNIAEIIYILALVIVILIALYKTCLWWTLVLPNIF